MVLDPVLGGNGVSEDRRRKLITDPSTASSHVLVDQKSTRVLNDVRAQSPTLPIAPGAGGGTHRAGWIVLPYIDTDVSGSFGGRGFYVHRRTPRHDGAIVP